MEIRLINTSDTKNFVEFYKKLLGENKFLLPTSQEAEKKAENEEEIIKKFDDYKQVFIALDGSEIVGFLGVSRSHLTRIKHIAKFVIGVLESHKKQGIATKLTDFAEKWSKEKGVEKIEITVIKDNSPAVEFFEKNGFKNEGTRHHSVNLDNKYYDEFFMAKVI